MARQPYRVFVSHGSHDHWVAVQIARAVSEAGAETFLDEMNIPKGSNFKKQIKEEIDRSDELIVLFTPWSRMRSWVWVEVGAAWGKGIPVIAIFYGMKASELDDGGQGKAILEDINLVELDGLAGLNEYEKYIKELGCRARRSV
jgi:hypothetical protein